MTETEFKLLHRDLAYLNLPWDQIRKIMEGMDNPLAQKTEDPLMDILRLIRNPKNFYFTCKYILNIDLGPFQNALLREMWNCPFPMFIGSRGSGKSFVLAVYAVLRALICQGCKVALTGAVFRQSKVIFEYVERIWNNAPVLQDMMSGAIKNGTSKGTDKWTFFLGTSEINAYPIGMGDKIRGQRANYLIVDEFASLNPEIFETVLSGFAAVSATPVENQKREATISLMKQMGIWNKQNDEVTRENYKGNQTIIAGTAYYSFNHFYKYWQKHKEIIESRGKKEIVDDIFNGEPPEGFDWRDWKVIRLPIELIPKGFMDEKTVARSKATQHSGTYLMEFGAVFNSDSDGFFKRSLVETCVTTQPIIKSCGPVQFKASLHGDPSKFYVFGVDPAASQDNFSIVVLELSGDHRRIIYAWTTTDKIHKYMLKKELIKEHDFYRFTARKIRNLMKTFRCDLIAMDPNGGGNAVAEALHEPVNLEDGELPIWLITPEHPLSDNKERDCDGNAGLHILYTPPQTQDWLAQANHMLKKDFETQETLFPFFDGLEVGLASEADARLGREVDTLEQCVMEIEELKDELASIIVTTTPHTGKEHWDTPEYKESGAKKGRLRKDRYSALLFANMAAHSIRRAPAPIEYKALGGFADRVPKAKHNQLYQGPSWFTEKVNGHSYGGAVNRNKIEGY